MTSYNDIIIAGDITVIKYHYVSDFFFFFLSTKPNHFLFCAHAPVVFSQLLSVSLII